MKALSLYQPWASWIAEGKKTIETRFYPTKHRGSILICSTKRPAYKNYPLGKALCIANLVDCRLMTKDDEEAAQCGWGPGRYAWVLTDIVPLNPPVNVIGQQGIFEIKIDGVDE